MPQQALIDFDEVDLSTVVASREDLREYLKQRGTFEMLDGIVQYSEESDIVIGFKDIRADDWWVEDHIPGRPLFPGALMIESGAQVCCYDFIRRHEGIRERFVGFGGVDKTRFRGVVEPGLRIVFAARATRVRSRMFTYSVQGFVERKLVFEAEIMGVVV
jgi:3-hydroxyacyl-[acyl-carrier-protein] dehydratase